MKLDKKQKLMWKMLGFTQTVGTEGEVTLSFSNKRIMHLVRPEHITQEVIKTLEDNGAKKDIDYTLELV